MRSILFLCTLLGGCVTNDALEHKTQALCESGLRYCITATELAACSISGQDAIVLEDCSTTGTPGNPRACTGVPGAARCASLHPAASWSLTEPAAMAGETGGVLVVSSLSECGPAGRLLSGVNIRAASPATCPAPPVGQLTFTAVRGLAELGEDLLLPSVRAQVTGSVNGQACQEWGGSARIVSDFPSWEVQIDATCTDKPALRVSGTIRGNE